MRFRQFIFLEQDPMGGAPPMPMGGEMGGGVPMGGGAPPMPMGGGDPMGGMGGMGMGGPPPPAQGGEAPAMPKTLDVWAVLDHILNNKPLPSKEAPKSPDDNMGGADMMSDQPPMGGPPGDQGSTLMV